MLSAAPFFAETYSAARERFRALAQCLQWQTEAVPIAARGPAGEELSIDVAGNFDSNASACLVVSSGLHGVEAFFGSALQCAVMQQWIDHPDAAPGLRCVFLHALNPYGFAWLRRADAANIDLNRNFLLEHEAYRGSPPGYAELDRFLNPQWPPHHWDAFMLQAATRIARVGLPALKNAIAGGQFEFSRGLFYGGAAASQTKVILEQHFNRWLGASRSVMHIDLHSGLGKWGSHKLLCDYPLTELQRQRLADWFGADAFESNVARDGQGVAYATRGGFGQWCIASQRERDYLFAYAEFGAYNILRTIAGLRAENQAHFWGKPNHPGTLRAKARLKELLCPASPDWRRSVLEQGIALVTKAAAAVARAAA